MSTKRRDLLACLEFIARKHNREFNEEAVIAGLPLENSDLTPSIFERAASRLRMSSQVLERDIRQINLALLPAVVILSGDRACVITKLDLKRKVAEVVYPDLNDSSIPVTLDSLEEHYAGFIIYVRPEFEFDSRADDSNKASKKHWFWGVVRENRSLYKDVLVAALLINVFALAMPLFVMNVYDRVVPNQAVETLWVLAAGVFVAITADMILRLMRTWFVDLAANRIDVKVSASILQKVLGMRMADKPKATGSFASGIQGFESVRSFFSSAAVNGLIDLPFVIFFTAVIAIINVYLAIPIIVGSVLLFAYALATQFKIRSIAEDSMRASAMRNASLVEAISSLPTVKAFNAQSKIQALWEKSTIYISQANARMRVLSSSLTTAGSWVQQTVAISIIIIGVYMVIEGELTVGGIIAAYLLSSRAMAPVTQAAGLLGQYHNSATVMESLNEIMSRESEGDDDPSKLSRPLIKGDISFSNVQFGYEEGAQDALSGVSFDIKAGERVAILGRNGSGKSSIVKLMLGLYHPDRGQIKVDGIDVKQLNLSQLRRNIGYLPQDSELLFGTIQDNITMATNVLNAERLVEVANQVGVGGVINRFSDGFSHLIEERGRNLSGGQRQLVALARALINDPPIIILDEPTGSLDHNSEAIIKQNLAETTQGKTLVMITHKTSMLDLVDRVIVVDNGRKVADGKREEVMLALRSGRVGGG